MKVDFDYGGSAFPCEGGSDSGLHADAGMSLRDYFAGQCLAAAIAEAPGLREYDLKALFGSVRTGIKREEMAAALAYRYADEMIARRSLAKPATAV